jgi:hypothetical protein
LLALILDAQGREIQGRNPIYLEGEFLRTIDRLAASGTPPVEFGWIRPHEHGFLSTLRQ